MNGVYPSIRALQELREMPILQSTELTKEEEQTANTVRMQQMKLDPQQKKMGLASTVLEFMEKHKFNESILDLTDSSGCLLKSRLANRTAKLDLQMTDNLFTFNSLQVAVGTEKVVHVALMLLYPEGKALINARQELPVLDAETVFGNQKKTRDLVNLINEIKAGSDWSKKGKTPLQIAVKKHNPLLIRLLLEEGADPTEQNENRQNTLEMAAAQLNPEDKDFREIMDILTEALQKKKEIAPIEDDYFLVSNSK